MTGIAFAVLVAMITAALGVPYRWVEFACLAVALVVSLRVLWSLFVLLFWEF